MSQPERLGRYTILGRLGAGAMGDVYLAEDPQIERRLAIKTVKVGGSASAVAERKARLLREAKAAGKLIHPHVVTLFDYGEDQGLVFLAFEYVEGEDLRQRLDRDPPLTVREALVLIRQTASALDLAHQHSIVHRDIKPANILLNASGAAKVTDFGIAKMRDQVSDLTATGSIIGTPHYMSPEQIRGEEIDGRSDLFSLGSVLYEILHRNRPFQGDSVTTVVYQILHADPLEQGHVRADLPAVLCELLARMLAKEREGRFATGQEVVQAIDRAIGALPEELLHAPASGSLLDDVPASHPSSGPPSFGSSPPPPPNVSPAPVPPSAPWAVPAGSPGTVPFQTGPSETVPTAPGPTPTLVEPAPAAPPTAGAAAAASGGRSKVWLLVGCIALPLVIGAGVVALLAPRIASWFETRRAAVTAVTAEADLAAPSPSVTEPIVEPPVEEEIAPETTTEENELGTDDPAAAEPPTASPREDAAAPAEVPTAPARGAPVREERPAAASPSAETPSRPNTRRADPAPRRTPPPSPPASEPDQPAAEEPEPEAAPAPEIPFDAELDSSLRLSFAVEPETAFVLLRSPSDERFTTVGQAEEFDATKRRGEPFSLPGDGVFYVMVRAEGYADHVVRVNADGRRPGPTTLSLRMGRPGQRASGGGGASATLRVREGVTFADGPARATVEVDGRDVGALRRYQDGKLLRLGPGRHRVVVSQGARRFELEVEVSAGAESASKVVRLGVDG